MGRPFSFDDEAAIRAGDPSGLVEAFATLPVQLREGYELGIAVDPPGEGRPNAVVLCGMGGSAAAAQAAAEGVSDPMVPILVVRGEELPDFADERTLVIALSYSGETDETLRAADDAAGRGARLVCIASGGRLGRGANGPAVIVPSGAPGPRAAIGWLAGAALGVMERAQVSFSEADETASWRLLRRAEMGTAEEAPAGSIAGTAEELGRLVEELLPGVPLERNRAKQVAEWLGPRVPVVWSTHPRGEAAAWRWKTAFNENAKIPAFSSSMPELGHHEIVGWTDGWGATFAVVVLRVPWAEDADGEGREARRLEATLEILDEAGIDHQEVRLPAGVAPLAGLLGLYAVGDLASAYHAIARGIDPAPIEAIARIKAKLR